MPKLPEQRERDFQKDVIDLAQTLGWRVAHFRAARTKDGWATPVGANGKGFPDLCLVRYDRIVFAELKRDSVKKLGPEQEAWHEAIRATPAEMFVWRPADTDEILAVLR